MTFRSSVIKAWTQVESKRLEKMKVNEDPSESHLPDGMVEKEERANQTCSAFEILMAPYRAQLTRAFRQPC